MLNQAIKKLETEMNASKANAYIQLVGSHLISAVRQDESIAANLINHDKTIEGSLSHMRKVAEKSKVGNMAVLTPEQGFKAVMEYFDIKGAVPVIVATTPSASTQEIKSSHTDINLDDLF